MSEENAPEENAQSSDSHDATLPLDDVANTREFVAGSKGTTGAERRSETGSIRGSRFARIRKHAQGGLGQVFLAADHELHREVALKEIQPEFAGIFESRRRFVLEAQVTGILEHPGIVPVYSLGSYPDGRPYYAMRFIRGESFEATIACVFKQSRTVTRTFYYSTEFRALLRRFIDVCNAIHYAHEKGVLHRDIKPANVMLGKYGETLVVDWGLAKLIETKMGSDSQADRAYHELRDISASSTTLGQTMGTPLYMSPEQARGELDELTNATDIYSLGAMLLSIATNKSPVGGKGRLEVVERVRKGEVHRVKELQTAAPWAIDAICCKAMQFEPLDRYGTAIELAQDLERWMADEKTSVSNSSEPRTERWGRLLRKYRSWTFPTFAASAIVMLVALLAALLVNSARVQEVLAKRQAQEFKSEAVTRIKCLKRPLTLGW
jgi:eukaryotic-like serine/threonine-protein kinase